MSLYHRNHFEISIGKHRVKVAVRVWHRLGDMRRYINRKYPKEHNGRRFIAYAETFQRPNAGGFIGTIHLAKSERSLDTVVHECVHIASGIVASLFPDAWFKPTWKRAEYNEECFADIVGALANRTQRIAAQHGNGDVSA